MCDGGCGCGRSYSCFLIPEVLLVNPLYLGGSAVAVSRSPLAYSSPLAAPGLVFRCLANPKPR